MAAQNPNQKMNTIASLHIDKVRRRKGHRCVDFSADLLLSVDSSNTKLDDCNPRLFALTKGQNEYIEKKRGTNTNMELSRVFREHYGGRIY